MAHFMTDVARATHPFGAARPDPLRRAHGAGQGLAS